MYRVRHLTQNLSNAELTQNWPSERNLARCTAAVAGMPAKINITLTPSLASLSGIVQALTNLYRLRCSGHSQMCMLLLSNLKKNCLRLQNVWVILRAMPPKTCFWIHTIMIGDEKTQWGIISLFLRKNTSSSANYRCAMPIKVKFRKKSCRIKLKYS